MESRPSEAAPRTNEHEGSASLAQCLIAPPPAGRRKLDSFGLRILPSSFLVAVGPEVQEGREISGVRNGRRRPIGTPDRALSAVGDKNLGLDGALAVHHLGVERVALAQIHVVLLGDLVREQHGEVLQCLGGD